MTFCFMISATVLVKIQASRREDLVWEMMVLGKVNCEQ